MKDTMREVLIGTTNPSKVRRFQLLLSKYNVKFYTPADLNIPGEPEERGRTPEENAVMKARYYGQYFDSVICNDSGLYFDGLALTDSRQPGLNIRTPGRMPRLNDEEMIVYYSELIRSLGGKVLAYYLDGIAVYHNHRISSYMEDADARKDGAFYMIGRPSPRRQPGWPLDSLSLNRSTLTYFVDEEDEEEDEEITSADSKNRLTDFLVSSLSLHPLKN
ncbi:MAG: non-canonical purine NTP pyrophosphatase [Dorea sp.]|nr:non-canonical purine NTP pyrophosphatase [Dorea sp.]